MGGTNTPVPHHRQNLVHGSKIWNATAKMKKFLGENILFNFVVGNLLILKKLIFNGNCDNGQYKISAV